MVKTPPKRILRINLSEQTINSERIPQEWRQQFIGGKGIGARYLYAEAGPNIDPFDPELPFLIMLGPLSGLLPGETRYAAITKSPLTGGFLDSYSGGTFPDRLAGSLQSYMGLIVTGQTDRLHALILTEDTARLEPVPELAGANVRETCQAFDGGVAAIGPAGEQQVAYATIGSDGGEHQAGRGGAGAVMGAKGLKAVVAQDPPLEEIPAIVNQYADAYQDSDVGSWRAASGTVETINVADATGTLQTHGWRESTFAGTDKIGIEAVEEAAAGREGDDTFPGSYRVPTAEGDLVPRGATTMALGAGLGIDEFNAVATLGDTCDQLGIDVISAGNAAAWAVLAADEGLIDRDLSFGDTEALQQLIEAIATREDTLCDVLAEGVTTAAKRYGGDAFVPTVKAMDAPPYDPRNATAMALAYATSDRGACHRRSMPIEEEPFDTEEWSPARQAKVVAAEQTRMSTYWCLIADSFFGAAVLDDYGAELLSAVGLEYTPAELQNVGERVWTVTRLFNLREGFDWTDDRLPPTFTTPPEDDNSTAETRVSPEQFKRTRQAYYAIREWDRRGRPTQALLERLGITAVPDGQTPLGETPIVDRESIIHDYRK